jgi:taurine dioxygenase
MVLAYDKLPTDVKQEIDSLIASHSFNASFAAAMPKEKRLAMKAQYPDAEHPVVRTHPETGDKVLFVNAYATHFVNYHAQGRVRVGQDYSQKGVDLLQYLISQAYNPEYQVRWRWKKNSVAIWDNRCTQHYAVMDYPPCHRKMERAAIIGDTRKTIRRRETLASVSFGSFAILHLLHSHLPQRGNNNVTANRNPHPCGPSSGLSSQ